MPKLKRLLKTLALLYLVIGTLALIPVGAILWMIIHQTFSAESFVGSVLLLIFIPIPVIILMTSQRYLKMKDAKTASDLSVLTGVFVWMIAGTCFSQISETDPGWRDLLIILGPIAIGIYVHKLFQKYIDLHFGVLPKTKPAPPPVDVGSFNR